MSAPVEGARSPKARSQVDTKLAAELGGAAGYRGRSVQEVCWRTDSRALECHLLLPARDRDAKSTGGARTNSTRVGRVVALPKL